MEGNLVTIFCISCGFTSTVPRRETPHKTKRMVCPKCRFSFHLSDRMMDGQARPLPAGVLMV